LNNNNLNQNQPEETNPRTKKRRWDAIIVGIAFSLAFVLLITKVAHVTPCEAINYFGIDAKACVLASSINTVEGQLASQHGLGFAIIVQYALLAWDLSEDLMSHVQQFLQNIGLQ
jgi:SNF family Na+-dependent transporter